MRIDVKKFLFIGKEAQRTEFFKLAQDAGMIQFINPHPKMSQELPQDIQEIVEAIKVVRGLPTIKQETLGQLDQADLIVQQIITDKRTIEKLEEEERITQLEIARIAAFGDFSLNDIAFIEQHGKCKIQFFFAKKGQVEKIPDNLVWINSDHGLDYFLAINRTPAQFDHFIEMQLHKSLTQLNEELSHIEKRLQQENQSLHQFAKYNTFLHQALTLRLNRYHLLKAETLSQSEMNGSLFLVMGWVPQDKFDLLSQKLAALDVYIEEIAIDEGEKIPTYLENRGLKRAGEDLVHIYDTPSHTDKDPSLWVLIFFSLFFAIIIGDAGYGLLFLTGSLWLRYRIKDPGRLGKRAFNLSFILFSACIVWGVLIGSYFGIALPYDHPIQKVSLLQWLAEKKAAYHLTEKDIVYQSLEQRFPAMKEASDAQTFLKAASIEKGGEVLNEVQDEFQDNIMMEIALLVGIIHITLSLLRYLNRNWSSFGWMLFIWGGYLYLPEYLKATTMMHYVFHASKAQAAINGAYLMVFGFCFAVVAALIQHRLRGLLEITAPIQLFSDILSYLRLYALGMAGAIMAATINEAAASAYFVVSVLMLLIGHAVNMLLSIMGGVIHGLRLNFIEWYHYSFEGGGKPFMPLEKIEIE